MPRLSEPKIVLTIKGESLRRLKPKTKRMLRELIVAVFKDTNDPSPSPSVVLKDQ